MNNPSDNHPMVHLVGNVPLDNAEAVFVTLGDSLGKHMKLYLTAKPAAASAGSVSYMTN